MQPTFRPGTLEDLLAVYDVFTRAVADLERRMGTPEGVKLWTDPAPIAKFLARHRTLFEHLTHTAEQFWVAEDEAHIIGYARATLQDGVRELIEFFVLPDRQGRGVGRELLARTFQASAGVRRAVIATTETHALARYLKAGVYPLFPIYFFSGKPRPVEVETDLRFEPVTAGPETLAALRSIDQTVLGFARDADHGYLLHDRRPYLYYRGEQLAGYGYFGNDTGPIALLHEADFPAVLARAEAEAVARHEEEFGMYVPLVNRSAVAHLLRRGFQLEPFIMLFMSDAPFGKFENYIISDPPLFM